MNKTSKLFEALQRFQNANDRIAKKYKAKISIQVPGEKEIILADGRKSESTREK
jgi:hypothetical protein